MNIKTFSYIVFSVVDLRLSDDLGIFTPIETKRPHAPLWGATYSIYTRCIHYAQTYTGGHGTVGYLVLIWRSSGLHRPRLCISISVFPSSHSGLRDLSCQVALRGSSVGCGTSNHDFLYFHPPYFVIHSIRAKNEGI